MNFIARTLIATSSLIFSYQAYGKCSWEIMPDTVKLTWTGYKTPKKVGVSGGFDSIKITGTSKSSDMMDALKGLRYEIDLNSTSSGDKVRDVRIGKILFFGTEKITGKFVKKDGDSLVFSTTVNKITKDIKLKPKVDGENLTAVGTFDLLDFSISKNVSEFAKACFEKHEGKTWTDVQAALNIKFKKICS